MISAGAKLEENLHISVEEGQFRDRPLGIFNFINEPFASSIVYPAVLAAWAFLAMDFKVCTHYTISNLFCDAPWATLVFILGFLVGIGYDLWLVIPAYYARKNRQAEE